MLVETQNYIQDIFPETADSWFAFTYKGAGVNRQVDIKIYDIFGACQAEYHFEDITQFSQTVVKFNNLIAGVYHVVFTNDLNEVDVKKLVVG